MDSTQRNTLIHNMLALVATAFSVAIKNPAHQQHALQFVQIGATLTDALEPTVESIIDGLHAPVASKPQA